MFKLQMIHKYVPVFAALMATAVTLLQSDSGSALLSALLIVINRQPQGF